MPHTKRAFDCDFKALTNEKEGTFEGYGSIFGNLDLAGDIVMPGAFMESLQEKMPALLWMHDPSQPIGKYTEVREDDRGLYVKGELNLDVQQGKEAWALLKQGAMKGLSIGYRIQKKEVDEETGVWTLIKLKLLEISVVTFPANELANVTGVKERPDNIRDFEKLLRDSGYSKREATAIASHGFKAVETEGDPTDAVNTAIATLKEFNGSFKETLFK